MRFKKNASYVHFVVVFKGYGVAPDKGRSSGVKACLL